MPLPPTPDLSCAGGPSVCVLAYCRGLLPDEVLRKGWADPTRSALRPAAEKFVAFLSQIAPIVPVLPTLPVHKYCAVYILRFDSLHGMEEVIALGARTRNRQWSAIGGESDGIDKTGVALQGCRIEENQEEGGIAKGWTASQDTHKENSPCAQDQ